MALPSGGGVPVGGICDRADAVLIWLGGTKFKASKRYSNNSPCYPDRGGAVTKGVGAKTQTRWATRRCRWRRVHALPQQVPKEFRCPLALFAHPTHTIQQG